MKKIPVVWTVPLIGGAAFSAAERKAAVVYEVLLVKVEDATVEGATVVDAVVVISETEGKEGK